MDKPFIEQGTGGPAYGSGVPTIEEKTKIRVISDSSNETCATLVIQDETHTMGNVLRSALARNPEVEFSGYTIPHPSINEIHLRIQTFETPVSKTFEDSLDTIKNMYEHILETFNKAYESHKSDKMEIN